MVDAPSRRGGADGDAKPPSGPRGPRILVDPALSSLAITIEADGEGPAPTFVGRVEQPELDPDVRRRGYTTGWAPPSARPSANGWTSRTADNQRPTLDWRIARRRRAGARLPLRPYATNASRSLTGRADNEGVYADVRNSVYTYRSGAVADVRHRYRPCTSSNP